MRNFVNGALVFKIWRRDGSGEVIAKFQYTMHAKHWAEFYASGCDKSNEWFLVVVCESECEVQTHMTPVLEVSP